MTAEGELRQEQRKLVCNVSGGALVECNDEVFLDTHVANSGDLFHFFRILDARRGGTSSKNEE
jgi:hypothetical protein